MSNINMSPYIQEAMANAIDDGGHITWTVELNHSTFFEDGVYTPIRAHNDEADAADPEAPRYLPLEDDAPFNPGGVVPFYPIPFMFVPPASDEGVSSKAKLAIESVSDQLARHLDGTLTTKEPITVIVRGYTARDTTEPGELFYGFMLRSVGLSSIRAEGELTFEEIEKKVFPNKFYTRDEYPNL